MVVSSCCVWKLKMLGRLEGKDSNLESDGFYVCRRF